MATYSSGDSSKPRSTHQAYVLNELKEAKHALALQDEAIKELKDQLKQVNLKKEKSSPFIHGSHHSHRHSSKALPMLTAMEKNIEEGDITIIDEKQIREAFTNRGRGHSPTHLKFFLLVFSKSKEDIK